jgi:hypothetical protein
MQRWAKQEMTDALIGWRNRIASARPWFMSAAYVV